MMAMAANHVMAKPSSFVGGVGVILSPLPSITPSRPNDREGATGPFKLEGGSRRHFVTMTEQLRQAFARIVLSERGGKLRTTKNEILEGNLYTGVEAMQVGQTDAIAKAASLAGVANFDLVDVNTGSPAFSTRNWNGSTARCGSSPAFPAASGPLRSSRCSTAQQPASRMKRPHSLGT